MAEKGGGEETPAISSSDSGGKSDSGQDPSDSGQDPETFRKENNEEGEKKEEKGKDEEEEEAELLRASKRRKNCPAALEKSLSSNRGFSFTFDTKIVTNGPIESTPKFGSFNNTVLDRDEIGLELGFHEEEEEKRKGSEEVGDGAKKGI